MIARHQLRTRLIAAALTLFTAASSVVAQSDPSPQPSPQLPAALDRLPHDAPFALGISSIDRVDSDIVELLQAAQLTTLSTFKEVLRVIGVGDAIDTTRGVGIAIVTLEDPNLRDALRPNAANAPLRRLGLVVVLPTITHDAFTAAMRAQPLDAPDLGLGGWTLDQLADVRRFTFADATLYTANAGEGWTAIARRPQTLALLSFDANQNAARLNELEPAMKRAALDADIVSFAKPGPLAQLIHAAATNDFEAAGLVAPRIQSLLGESLDIDQPDHAAATATALTTITERLIPIANQFQTAVWIAEPGPRGVRIHGLARPRLGTPLGAAALLASLPSQPPDREPANTPQPDQPVDYSTDPLAGMPTVGWLAAASADFRGRRGLVSALKAAAAGIRINEPDHARLLQRFLDSIDDTSLVVYAGDDDDALTPVARARRAPQLVGPDGADPWFDIDATFDLRPDTPLLATDADARPNADPGSAFSDVVETIASLIAQDPAGAVRITLLVQPHAAVFAPSRQRAERTIELTSTAAESPLRRIGIAGERMVRAVRRVLPDRPLVEVHINLGALIDRYKPWLDERDLSLFNPNRYPPLAAALTVESTAVELTAFVPAAAIQNAIELRAVLPALVERLSDDLAAKPSPSADRPTPQPPAADPSR